MDFDETNNVKRTHALWQYGSLENILPLQEQKTQKNQCMQNAKSTPNQTQQNVTSTHTHILKHTLKKSKNNNKLQPKPCQQIHIDLRLTSL